MKNKSSRSLQKNLAEAMSQRTELFQRCRDKTQKVSTTNYHKQSATTITAERILAARRAQDDFLESQEKKITKRINSRIEIIIIGNQILIRVEFQLFE
jgi:MFS superfamily sulfate permease-like transporter